MDFNTSPYREKQKKADFNQDTMIHLAKFRDKENSISSSACSLFSLANSLEQKSVHHSNHRYHHHHPILKKQFKSVETILIIAVWYFFSFVAIFLSKHVIDNNDVDLLLFCAIQLGISASMAYVNTYLSSRKEDGKYSPHRDVPNHFTRDFYFSMAVIGLMRLLVIYLGLLSMKHVALSFMETVKSSAPLFTVIISFLVLKERSGILIQASILPIMFGLLLCSVFEVSFTWIGFLAAMGANVAECMQFVLSKIFLGTKLNPSDFQLYSSLTGLLSIIPVSLFLLDVGHLLSNTTGWSLAIMLAVGLSYYLQTLMAWFLMEFLSPVTHSICNTMKCGVAVWLSIPIFGNHVTLWSGIGSCVVIAGVVLYQKARSFEKQLSQQLLVAAGTGSVKLGDLNNNVRNDGCGVVVGGGGVGDGGGGVGAVDGCVVGGGGGGCVDGEVGGVGQLIMLAVGDSNLSEEIIQNING